MPRRRSWNARRTYCAHHPLHRLEVLGLYAASRRFSVTILTALRARGVQCKGNRAHVGSGTVGDGVEARHATYSGGCVIHNTGSLIASVVIAAHEPYPLVRRIIQVVSVVTYVAWSRTRPTVVLIAMWRVVFSEHSRP